jgi:hypothetical protein
MPTDRAEQHTAVPRSARRGDLAIIRTATSITCSSGPSYDMTSYRVGVVASVTRDGQVKAVRWPTDGPDRKPELVARMGRHALTTVPAVAVDVPAATAAILANRAEKDTGYLPPYDTPDQLLRELTPHTRDRDALAALTADTRRRAQEEIDFHRAVCARCGVNTYGNGTVGTDETGCPVPVCKACPTGVDFTTAYPTGLEVMVTDGFAAGSVAKIESVADAYPTDPRTGDAHYAGRSYMVTLPVWGRRTFPEGYVRPTDDAAIARYAVHRDHPVDTDTSKQSEPAAAETTPPKETELVTEQPRNGAPYDVETAYVHVDDWDRPVRPDAEWVVWNAARPLMGSEAWQGKFRRGVYYAAARRDDPLFERWAEENCRLDGHLVEVVDNARSRELLNGMLERNGYSVQDYLDAGMTVGDTARDHGLPWSDTEADQRFLTLRESGYTGPIDQDGHPATDLEILDIFASLNEATPQDVTDDWEQRETYLVARDRFTDEEWAEAMAGRCGYVVESGMSARIKRCGAPSDPESPFANCSTHDRVVLDESPQSWPVGAYNPPEHPYTVGYEDAEDGLEPSPAGDFTDPDYLEGYEAGKAAPRLCTYCGLHPATHTVSSEPDALLCSDCARAGGIGGVETERMATDQRVGAGTTADAGGEVTGLVSAQQYAASMASAFSACDAGVEEFTTSLQGLGVSGEVIAAADQAAEAQQTAAAAWHRAHAALLAQDHVAQAYEAAPGAGTRQFVTGE